jgi:hypothetical protein
MVHRYDFFSSQRQIQAGTVLTGLWVDPELDRIRAGQSRA